MTEKRFTRHISFILDNKKKGMERLLTIAPAIDLLNELHEENQRLRKELDKLKVVNEMLSMDFTQSEHELLKENEQLKKDCTAIIYHNQEYRKENEQLKQRIKQLEDNIVTKLNIIQGDERYE